MADIKGDPAKQPPGCGQTHGTCPNMKFVQHSESESYHCPVCGESYTLDYDDMR